MEWVDLLLTQIEGWLGHLLVFEIQLIDKKMQLTTLFTKVIIHHYLNEETPFLTMKDIYESYIILKYDVVETTKI